MSDGLDREWHAAAGYAELRRALWFCRWQDTHPNLANPAAAQYDGVATASSVRAEFRRRGWKIPKPTRREQA